MQPCSQQIRADTSRIISLAKHLHDFFSFFFLGKCVEANVFCIHVAYQMQHETHSKFGICRVIEPNLQLSPAASVPLLLLHQSSPLKPLFTLLIWNSRRTQGCSVEQRKGQLVPCRGC